MSPRSKDENERIREDRRSQILQAALAIFARCGFSATRMTDIAEEAGMSNGLAYHYFSSKEEIFHQLVTMALDISIGVYRRAAASNGSAWDNLSTALHNVIPAAYQGIGNLFFLIMIQTFTYQDIPMATRELVTQRLPEHTTILSDLIQRAQAEGTAKEGDPTALAVALNSAIQGLAVMKAAWAEAPLPDADTVLRMVQA